MDALLTPFAVCVAVAGRDAVPSLQHSDFVLGLSIRRHVTGYALLRFEDLLPLQFGLIDVRKALEVQQKALEIAAVLRDLRQAAPEKLRQVAPGSAQLHMATSAEGASSKSRWRWVVSVDDSTVDRSPPTNARESGTQRTIAMLQGLVIRSQTPFQGCACAGPPAAESIAARGERQWTCCEARGVRDCEWPSRRLSRGATPEWNFGGRLIAYV